MGVPKTEERLRRSIIRNYALIARHTAKRCTCKRPASCCHHDYCGMAIAEARIWWGTDLQLTDHPTLPLMGPDGCTVAPHLRPVCSLYSCTVYAPEHHLYDEAWSLRYWALRRHLVDLEAALRQMKQTHGDPRGKLWVPSNYQRSVTTVADLRVERAL